MSIKSKLKKALEELQGPTPDETKEINETLARPEIAKIRAWDPESDLNERIQADTLRVVEDYVKSKRRKR